MNIESFMIYGSDKKMISCYEKIRSYGYKADILNTETNIDISSYDYIILPIPTIANSKINGTHISLDEFVNLVTDNQMVFCGNLDPSAHNNFYSYYNENFLIKNSRLTAQGVLKLISMNVEEDFNGLKVVVVGYGRCGKAVCKLLKGCGMNVTSVSRRNVTRVLAQDDGLKTGNIDYLNDTIENFDIIVNTVPVNIINKESIAKLSQKNIYIEIASKPYGFDISEYDVYNFKYILGESLPGRFTPVSAGYNIADTVLDILKEAEYG